MKNYVQAGDMAYAVAPTGGVKSGFPYLYNQLFGIASSDAASGVTYSLWLRGTFNALPKKAEAWTFGQAIYWDDTAKQLTSTAGANVLAGHATQPQLSTATTGEIRLVR